MRISSDGINTFGTSKHRGGFNCQTATPNILTFHLFIAFFVCRMHGCSISPKIPSSVAKTWGSQNIDQTRQNNRCHKESKKIEDRIHTPLNELHTSSKVNTRRSTDFAVIVAQRVTYVIEGHWRRSTGCIRHRRSIHSRRSTSYIRHRRSIHTPLNELHTSSKVNTCTPLNEVTYVIESRYNDLSFPLRTIL